MSRTTGIGLGAALVIGAGAFALYQCGPSGPTERPTGGETEGGETPIASVVDVSGNLTAFESEDALRRFLTDTGRRMTEQAERQRREREARHEVDVAAEEGGAPEAQAEATVSSDEPSDDASESVTNTQEAGVDEGGIVKVHGDHLVVLRRGRLFTVRIGDGDLSPVAMVDVFPPGDAPDSWYDEMLIAGDTIVVVGYSYEASATELGMFRIDDAGALAHRGTYYLRSNDYYSSRNYASRLIGNTLIFYMPYFVFQERWEDNSIRFDHTLPALATHRGGGRDDWSEIVSATRVYRPVQPTPMPVMHTVVTCDLAAPSLSCEATSILGPYGRNFYVSGDAVYVWVSEGYTPWFLEGGEPEPVTERGPTSVLYRLPLDGGRPGAVKVWGTPTDQFSFKERDEHINVLVRAEGGGDMMWMPEASEGDVALLRLPLSTFGRGEVGSAARTLYRTLPRPRTGYTFQNRFVGDYVLYGTGSGWGWYDDDHDPRVFVHPYAAAGTTTTLELPHGVDRIEALGRNAVVVGTDGRNLHFSAVDLAGTPRLADRLTQPNASQGETRSHGFFFKPSGERDGTLGLPIRGGGAPGWVQLRDDSAAILYLRVQDLSFTRLGALTAQTGEIADACQVSCVDWYGNARPLFLRNRVFALLGYELVEGQLSESSIREVRRTNMYTSIARTTDPRRHD